MRCEKHVTLAQIENNATPNFYCLFAFNQKGVICTVFLLKGPKVGFETLTELCSSHPSLNNIYYIVILPRPDIEFERREVFERSRV